MKAKLYFYIDPATVTLTEKQKDTLNQGFKDWSAKNKWLERYAQCMGLPKKCGFWFWDREHQQFYVTEANGKQFDYSPAGFPLPDFMIAIQNRIDKIRAEVFFFSRRKLKEGYYEDGLGQENAPLSGLVKAVLHYEQLDDGRERYHMIVHGALNIEDLSHFVCWIREQDLEPHPAWS